ncbi:MAG: hypothetical protein COA79_20935 [Planctomycetota bacterium]|nr:MAG: hypothetical protein COA79_20935 [Planctomycetota bacterium]
MTSYLNFNRDIYRKYYPLVFSTCKRFLKDPNFQEDATQSVFLLFVKKEDSIDSNLSSWFYWSSVNISKVINKDSQKYELHHKNTDEIVDLNKQEEHLEPTLKELNNALRKLPEKKRSMLLMKYYEGLTYKEIGKHHKCKEDNVRKIVKRTINLLQSKMTKKDVLITTLLVQLFFPKDTFANINTSNQFIIQNSLQQQLIIKGVQKMYLMSKLKLVILIGSCLLLSSLVTVSYLIANTKPIISENKTISKTTITLPLGKYILYEGKYFKSSNGYIVLELLQNENGGYYFKSKSKKKIKIKNNKKEISFSINSKPYVGQTHITHNEIYNGIKYSELHTAIGTIKSSNNKIHWRLVNYKVLKYKIKN